MKYTENQHDTQDALISLIVPVYNVGKFLAECLGSIVRQSYKNLEIIVVDDGSADSCREIIQTFAENDGRIKPIFIDHKGLAAARNIGLDQASGEFICFIDSDDSLHLENISYLVNAAQQNDADIVMCQIEKIYHNNKMDDVETPPRCKVRMLEKMAVMRSFLTSTGNVSNVFAKLFRARLWDGIRFPEGQKYEDINTTYLPFLKANAICELSLPLYYYNLHEDSESHRDFEEHDLDYIKAADSAVKDIIDQFPELAEFGAIESSLARMTVYKKMLRSGRDGSEKAAIRKYLADHLQDLAKIKTSSVAADGIFEQAKLLVRNQQLFDSLFAKKHQG